MFIVIKAASSVHAQGDVLIVIPLGGSPIIASLMNIVTTIPLPPTFLSLSLSLGHNFLYFYSSFQTYVVDSNFKLQRQLQLLLLFFSEGGSV